MFANFERNIKYIIDNESKGTPTLTENTTENKKILKNKILVHEVSRTWVKG